MGKKKKEVNPVVRNCKRCGYQWEQRLHPEDKPRQCPDCKSNRWDRDEAPRKRAEARTEAPQVMAATA